jgi:hypothetical protein
MDFFGKNKKVLYKKYIALIKEERHKNITKVTASLQLCYNISKTIAQKKGIGYNVFSKGENKPNANRLYTGGRRKYAKCKIGFEILQYCYT